MSKLDRRFKNKYFCDKCRDRNYLVVCGCGCGGIMPDRNKQCRKVKCIRGHNITPHVKIYKNKEERKRVTNEKAKLFMRKYRKTKKYRQTRDKYYNENKEKYSKGHKLFIQNNPKYPKRYRKKNKEHLSVMARKNRKRNHKRFLEYERNYRNKYPDRQKKVDKKYLRKVRKLTTMYQNGLITRAAINIRLVHRIELITLLGPVCVMCGYKKDWRALQIDHINGGGYRERARFGGSVPIYTYYLKNPKKAFERLQILCANCNAVKRNESENPKRYIPRNAIKKRVE